MRLINRLQTIKYILVIQYQSGIFVRILHPAEANRVSDYIVK